jgi:hypothetical protein
MGLSMVMRQAQTTPAEPAYALYVFGRGSR